VWVTIHARAYAPKDSSIQMNMHKIVVVLGMHRSGTSATARSLEVLGVNLGDNLYPATIDNPKGFWEDQSILGINEELLARTGRTYDRLGLVDWTAPDDPDIAAIRARAVTLLREKCGENSVWGFKDPRTARLLAFWQPVFQEAGCEPAYVIALRNPISVFESLRKHGFPAEKAFYLWLEHLVPAMTRTRGAMRIIVDYDMLLEHPREQLLRVTGALRLGAPEASALADFENEFLEKGLRHSLFTPRDVEQYPAMPVQVVTAYACLAKLANDELAPDSAQVEQTFDELSRSLRALAPALETMARKEQLARLDQQGGNIQRLETLVAQKQRAIEQLTANVEETQRVVEQLSANLESLSAQFEQVRTELHAATREARALKQTRWFRLREVLLFHPFGFRKLLSLARIVAGGLIPRRLRPAVLPQLDRLAEIASLPPGATDAAAVAYRVKLPPEPHQDAPVVVHVIANFMTGGSSRLVVDLIESLGSHFRQVIFTQFNPRPPAYIGVDIEEVRSSDAIEPFLDYFRRMRPDFLHVHYWGDCDEGWYARAIEAADHLGLPVVQNINTPIEPHRSDVVARYVYVSDYVRSVFGEPHARHVTIYPGANFQIFTRDTAEQAPEDCVGMVYRLERDKLNEDAIVPFIRIAQLRPQTRVLIVGGGGLLDAFQSAVRVAGVANNFEFTNYVSYEALPDLYRRMSLFIAPVWKESFGQVVPFAMSMRIPVVGYDIGAIGEILGNRQLLAPPGDAESLARMAVSLLDSPEQRRSIGEALQRRAEEKFSVEAMNDSYFRLYTQMTQGIDADPA
jgi:glycosyltransferase involved in cell wall biosynthesis